MLPTVPSVTHSCRAMPALERPSAIWASTSRSRALRAASGSSRRRAATSSATSAGSTTDPPLAIRSRVSMNSSTSVTRLLSTRPRGRWPAAPWRARPRHGRTGPGCRSRGAPGGSGGPRPGPRRCGSGHPDVHHHELGACSATRASSWAASPAWPTTWNPERWSRLASPSRSRTSSSARTTRNPFVVMAQDYGLACACEHAAETSRSVSGAGAPGWADRSHADRQRAARAADRRRLRGAAVLGGRPAHPGTARQAVRGGAGGRQPAGAAGRRPGDLPAWVRHQPGALPGAVAARPGRLPRGGRHPGAAGGERPRPAGAGPTHRRGDPVLPAGLLDPAGGQAQRTRPPPGPWPRPTRAGGAWTTSGPSSTASWWPSVAWRRRASAARTLPPNGPSSPQGSASAGRSCWCSCSPAT